MKILILSAEEITPLLNMMSDVNNELNAEFIGYVLNVFIDTLVSLGNDNVASAIEITIANVYEFLDATYQCDAEDSEYAGLYMEVFENTSGSRKVIDAITSLLNTLANQLLEINREIKITNLVDVKVFSNFIEVTYE